jgi:hypothetical protein
MRIKETIGVSFPGFVESPPLEDVVVLVDSAGVALGVRRAFSARVRGVRDGGGGLIASRCVEIPLVGSDGEVSGVLYHTGPPPAHRAADPTNAAQISDSCHISHEVRSANFSADLIATDRARRPSAA